MNEQVTMSNDEVMEVVEVMPNNSGNGLRVIGGLAVVGGLIYGGYKLIRKLKSKKSDGVIEADPKYVEDDVENVG